ncbi:MAG TPA: uroporphyrinogen decarboxylase family protein, partial [Burkholderiaceae bacterium]|nr:uroporphyrinogen decarboxylase family protein [Burkholderiaceae bacterium]
EETAMAVMTKRERFEAAVRGGPIDRPPLTAWIHFGTDALGGTEHAMRHARFFRDYGLDICKVVNDFRYPMPPGLETLLEPADFARLWRAPPDSPSFAEELKCIRLLRAELGPDVPIMITTFDPFQQVMRRVGYTKAKFVFEHPDEAIPMLERVSDALCDYMGAVREAGCDAVFYSINGAITPPGKRGIDDATYRTFVRPYEIRMAEAMAGMVRVLHVHGSSLTIGRVLDYPFEVLSVSDRLKGNPTLAELRGLTDRCLMGGIDESSIIEMSLPEVRAQVRDAIAQAGRERFILSPGCTIPTQTPWYLLKAIGETLAQA